MVLACFIILVNNYDLPMSYRTIKKPYTRKVFCIPDDAVDWRKLGF